MTILELIQSSILNNQIVTGLSTTAILGFCAYELRNSPARVKSLLERMIVVHLSVRSADQAFQWLDMWLAVQPYSKRSRSLVLKSYEASSDGLTPVSDQDNVVKTNPWNLSPGVGFHWFFWRKRLIWLEREVHDGPSPGGRSSKEIPETIHLYTFGRSQKLLRAIVQESFSLVQSKNLVTLKLWRGWWSQINGKNPRKLDTITLVEGQQERILADIDKFLGAQQWYAQRGIPWRRGYLFAGPPGTGKTSYVMALSSYLNRPLCVLNLGSIDNDDALFSACMDAPLNAIILIEDIDCAVTAHSREPIKPAGALVAAAAPAGNTNNEDDEPKGGITKAGLLNALDGVTTPDGRILIMTTNYPEKLDAALIRPGRVDVLETFNYLGAKDQVRFAQHYYSGDIKPLDFSVAPAELQRAFMLYPDDYSRAREELQRAQAEREKLTTSPGL